VLCSLQIRNFAIIDQVTVEFEAGMTVLTGETGAGKSILVDALGLVLGERGGAGLTRKGTERAEFCAVFDLSKQPETLQWLEQHALDSDGECLLRRVISADGRSRAFINSNPVPLQSLKTLAEKLLDIHGQHFHQSLGRRPVQRDLLDHFASAKRLRSLTESTFRDWQALSEERGLLQEAEAERASRLDLLSFQTRELESLELQPGETDQLLKDRVRLQNSGRLVEGVAVIMQSIYDADNGNAQSLLANACQALEKLSELDEQLKPVLGLLQDANIQVGEAADSLRRYADSVDLDPAERDQIEDRLDAIQTVARKHRVAAEQLSELQENLLQQLCDLQNAEARGSQLEAETRAAMKRFREAAGQLSSVREKAATAFSSTVTDTMADLGMAGGVFEVSVTRRDADDPRPYGIDNIEYLISANPGQPLMPLSKVASGGELSRMSLAIQVIASDGSPIPTMVFDEVDSGVGGGIAEMVGQCLRGLGGTRQVLCVTHLPQVASMANHHYRVMKMTDGKSTRTNISELNNDERIEELARMLGGVDITDRTRAHAAEMLQTGDRYKSNVSNIGKRA